MTATEFLAHLAMLEMTADEANAALDAEMTEAERAYWAVAAEES